MRDTVAAPIEAQVSGVEGMMYMSSQSTNDGVYNLMVTFKLGTDSDMAQVLVQNRVSLALPVIPQLVQNEGINVKKMSPNTMMIVNLTSPDDRYDSIFLSNYATIYIKDELGRLPGVAGITYLGQRDYSLRAWLDPDKLAALNLSASDVVTAISQQNVQVAAGQIGQPPVSRSQQFQLTINTLGRLTDPEQFASIILEDVSNRRGTGARRSRGDRHRDGGQWRGQFLDAGLAGDAGQHEHLDRRCPSARRGEGHARFPAIRPNLHARRQAIGRAVDLSIARLQRVGHRQRRLCQNEGTEVPVPRRAGLRNRLRHDPIHPRIGQRGVSHACATRSFWWRSSCWRFCKTGRPRSFR